MVGNAHNEKQMLRDERRVKKAYEKMSEFYSENMNARKSTTSLDE